MQAMESGKSSQISSGSPIISHWLQPEDLCVSLSLYSLYVWWETRMSESRQLRQVHNIVSSVYSLYLPVYTCPFFITVDSVCVHSRVYKHP